MILTLTKHVRDLTKRVRDITPYQTSENFAKEKMNLDLAFSTTAFNAVFRDTNVRGQ